VRLLIRAAHTGLPPEVGGPSEGARPSTAEPGGGPSGEELPELELVY
jgi:hypothetical protein